MPRNSRKPVVCQGMAWLVSLGLLACSLSAGPYAPRAGEPGAVAISRDDPGIALWASSVVDLSRGPVNKSNVALGTADYGSAAGALGPAEGTSFDVVSLGDGGSITVSFPSSFADGPGADFAVFENSFDGAFLELAFVEVSSDGIHFLRFPSVSLTQIEDQVDTYATLDPTDIHNLAGRDAQGYGTPFDLSDLTGLDGASNLDFAHVQYVRLVDVVGSIDEALGSRDSTGRLINDPWPTPFGMGGFDLDGVAVLSSSVPEPSLLALVPMFALLARRRPGASFRPSNPTAKRNPR